MKGRQSIKSHQCKDANNGKKELVKFGIFPNEVDKIIRSDVNDSVLTSRRQELATNPKRYKLRIYLENQFYPLRLICIFSLLQSKRLFSPPSSF